MEQDNNTHIVIMAGGIGSAGRSSVGSLMPISS